MWNARLDESQVKIKIAERNTNKLIYADDITLMEESEAELKSLLMRVKEENEKLAWNSTYKKLRLWCAVTSLHANRRGTAVGNCSHEIERPLLLERKTMTNLNSILKSRDITLLTKAHTAKAMVFLVVIYECESWTKKKAEGQRTDAFELELQLENFGHLMWRASILEDSDARKDWSQKKKWGGTENEVIG